MKKQFLIGITIGFTLLMLASSSDWFMQRIFALRENNDLLRSDNYYFGDLFGMSFLPQFKIKNDFVSSDVNITPCIRPRTIHLCIAGDSYLGEFFVKSPDQFCSVGALDYLNLGSKETKNVTLRAEDVNIMLIEAVERNIRTLVNPEAVSSRFTVGHPPLQKQGAAKAINTFLRKTLFNSNIEQNLEFNLFDYRLFTPVRELKAALNHRVFNRTSPDVAVPPDSKYLLYQPTIDPRSPYSSFSRVTDGMIDSIVNSLNALHDHYRKAGFHEVYFSPIPNPATVLYPALGEYNRLIPRIVNHPGLKIGTLDITDKFASESRQIFLTSDSHWNVSGFRVWLNEFNGLLGEAAVTSNSR